METEGPIMCWQESATDPYPEQTESNPYTQHSFHKFHFDITLRLPDLPSGLFPSGFSGNILYGYPISSTHATERRGRTVNTPVLYSGGPGFKISARRLAIMTEVSPGFPQSLQANSRIVP
jgi:hypothetical protein